MPKPFRRHASSKSALLLAALLLATCGQKGGLVRPEPVEPAALHVAAVAPDR